MKVTLNTVLTQMQSTVAVQEAAFLAYQQMYSSPLQSVCAR